MRDSINETSLKLFFSVNVINCRVILAAKFYDLHEDRKPFPIDSTR